MRSLKVQATHNVPRQCLAPPPEDDGNAQAGEEGGGTGALVLVAEGVLDFTAVCIHPGSMTVVCFVSQTQLPGEAALPEVVFRAFIGGQEVANSPYNVDLRPTSEAMEGCVRPGVARVTSQCTPEAPTFVRAATAWSEGHHSLEGEEEREREGDAAKKEGSSNVEARTGGRCCKKGRIQQRGGTYFIYLLQLEWW